MSKSIIFTPYAEIKDCPLECDTCGRTTETAVTETELVQCMHCWLDQFRMLTKIDEGQKI